MTPGGFWMRTLPDGSTHFLRGDSQPVLQDRRSRVDPGGRARVRFVDEAVQLVGPPSSQGTRRSVAAPAVLGAAATRRSAASAPIVDLRTDVAPSATVAISTTARSLISDQVFALTRIDGGEVGGWLFGQLSRRRFDGATLDVRRAIPASRNRTRAQVHLAIDELLAERRRCRAEGTQLELVGDWHAQPNGDPPIRPRPPRLVTRPRSRTPAPLHRPDRHTAATRPRTLARHHPHRLDRHQRRRRSLHLRASDRDVT